MVTRIHFADSDEADRAAEALFAAGHEVAVVKERFAGEDDDEDAEHVVATTASRQQVLASMPGLADDVFVDADE